MLTGAVPPRRKYVHYRNAEHNPGCVGSCSIRDCARHASTLTSRGSSGTAQIDVDRCPLIGESNSRRCIA
ncbi:hypothetical protein THAOC_27906 [Thalassiosira oceanica]|uniref:Uncharacterized protein n=1 Tax=Thalassiosira oceanica TaxID=159749 RepID=K0RVD7_THAOC|nr:hypothetical protein THAOC_27906 [Thalassiosira oceanica]|eukprot:EJK52786.1 hypothetical protein THAOC_27906 [Thalassiosira oceanica]